MIYYAMIQRLDVGENEKPENARKRLDNALGVPSWAAPGRASAQRQTVPEDPGAPDWWHGDEDASQVFLNEMGVNLGGH